MKEQLQKRAELLDVIDQLGEFSEDEYIEDELIGENTQIVRLILVDGEEEAEQQPNTVEGSIDLNQTERIANETQSMLLHYSLWVRVACLIGLVVFFGPVLLVPIGVPVFQLPVIVMIEPVTAQLELETDISIKARQLSVPTFSQSKTVATTGQGYQPAKSAQGLVTLYNALPSSQYVQAGTLITSTSGVQVVTDQGMTIPGAQAPTMGEATVSAHALSPGKTSNIGAFDINGPCCVAYILAKNTTAFSGGLEARNYPMVAEKDIEQAANDLGASLESSIQEAFSTQLQNGEAMTSPQCQPTVSSSHKAGDEAKHVSVTVAFSCSASAYSTERLQQALHFKLSLYGAERLNSCYQQQEEATILTLSSKAEGDTVTLTVKARASYAYQFTETLFDLYKKAIAGKSKRDALAWLQQQPGVAQATIDQEQLPLSMQSIQLVIWSAT